MRNGVFVVNANSKHPDQPVIRNFAIQSTLVIFNFKGLSETLRDIRTSKCQSCRSEENNKSNNHI